MSLYNTALLNKIMTAHSYYPCSVWSYVQLTDHIYCIIQQNSVFIQSMSNKLLKELLLNR